MRKLSNDAIEKVVFRFVRLRLIIRMRYILKHGEIFQRKRRMTAVLSEVKKKMKLASVTKAESSSLPSSQIAVPEGVLATTQAVAANIPKAPSPMKPEACMKPKRRKVVTCSIKTRKPSRIKENRPVIKKPVS